MDRLSDRETAVIYEKIHSRWRDYYCYNGTNFNRNKGSYKKKKLKKYFSEDSIDELIEFLDIIAEKVEISPKYYICRDPKDNFLLDLIDYSGADYLVTGDKDLLMHNPFLHAAIVSPANFEKIFKSS